MTRFARAKGSKSCNEKAPEDGTPWEVMRDQLMKAKVESEEAKKREEAELQRIQNYENFLKEQKVQKRKATWCDFPEDETKKAKGIITESQNEASPMKKSKKKNKHNDISVSEQSETTVKPPPPTDGIIPKKKKPKSKNNVQANTDENKSEIEVNNSQSSETISPNTKKNKKKNKPKKQADALDNSKGSQENNDQTSEGQENTAAKQNKNANKLKKKKGKKFVDGDPVRRKVINDRSFKLIINGKDVELVRFDGFPIMKKDAERLEELKTSMMNKGIPKSEVQRTLKLERRRAEKALARMKRDVCYNCRKGGHNLSDCPELKSKIPGADTAEGICFKCGSTEHRQFECKVQRDKEFRFATCFICKESGHIARQCPDNPKGLYPNGGCCKLCGDVTHLRKDCPTVNDKKEETSIKLQTLDGAANIEEIGQQSKNTNSEAASKKPKKIRF